MTEFEQKLIRALIRVRDARNEPDVVKSIIDKAIGAEEDVIPIDFDFDSETGEPTKIIPKEDNRQMYVNKNGEIAIAPEGMSTETLKDILAKGGDPNEHFGEEQAEGLDNLLEGLRDTPHDNRW